MPPKRIPDPASADIKPPDMVPRVSEVLIERDLAFVDTDVDSKPVSFGIIIVATDSVIVKLWDFGVFAFGHHPLDGQELFVEG